MVIGAVSARVESCWVGRSRGSRGTRRRPARARFGTCGKYPSAACFAAWWRLSFSRRPVPGASCRRTWGIARAAGVPPRIQWSVHTRSNTGERPAARHAVRRPAPRRWVRPGRPGGSCACAVPAGRTDRPRRQASAAVSSSGSTAIPGIAQFLSWSQSASACKVSSAYFRTIDTIQAQPARLTSF